jgi:hypothetical protein
MVLVAKGGVAMALLWIDGFDAYGTTPGSAPAPTGVLARKYIVVTFESSFDVEAGRLGGYCLEFGTSAQYLTSPPLTTNATMVVGIAVKYPSWPNTGTLLAFMDENTLGMNIRVTPAGEIAVYRGSTLLATTSGAGLTVGGWYYVEFKVVCGSSGSYEVRINGVNKLSDPSENTKAGTHDYHTAFRIGEIAAVSLAHMVDDFYCLDGSGSVNNDFLGNQKVVTIFPIGDVTGYTDFTPSTGVDHYALVDENPINNDTDYVESSTANHTDLWDYEAVSGLGAIAGIQINTHARETDAEDFTLKTVIKSGSTRLQNAGEVVSSTTYKSLRQVNAIDPASGTNEQQTVAIDDASSSGTFTLTYSGQTTAAIAYNADAATVKSALEALSNIEVGDVAVTGGPGPGTDWVVEFTGFLGSTDVTLMTGDGTNLVGGSTTVTITQTVQGIVAAAVWAVNSINTAQFGVRVG